MKEFSFTIASDLASAKVIAVAIDSQGHYHPWTFPATAAALRTGAACGCGQCHNCAILAALLPFGALLKDAVPNWHHFSPTRKGAIHL